MGVRLRPSREVRVVQFALEVLVVAAVAVTLRADGQDLTAILGIATVPTTFAVALALVRETSSLSNRLRERSRHRLLVEVAVLWAVAFVRVV